MNTISDSLKDIAAGVSQPISTLAVVYAHIARIGKADAVDIRQFTSCGVPIVEAIACFIRRSQPAFGPNDNVSLETVSQRIKDEGIPLYIIDGAIGILTEPGGKFFNLSKHNK